MRLAHMAPGLSTTPDGKTFPVPLSLPVPVKLIASLAKFRARESAEREKAAAGTRKRR